MTVEQKIIAHYANKDSSEVERGNAHLHIGGARATRYFFDTIDLQKDMCILDIGCGVGGPAIIAAEDYGCHVTGIDLTPEFIAIAQKNAALSSAAHLLEFRTAHTDKLDFPENSFDVVMFLHVGMNIPDKKTLYNRCARVLKKGGILAIYDILAQGNIANMIYPVPWAKTIETSFLEDQQTIGEKLKAAGLDIAHHENCREYAISAITKMLELERENLNPFRKIVVKNLLQNVQNNSCAPEIILAKKS